MAKTNTAVSVEDKVAELEKKCDNMAAKIRRMSDNWKKFCQTHLGEIAKDGAIIRSIAIFAVTVMFAQSAMADYEEDLSGNNIVNWKKARITSNGTFQTMGSITCTGTVTAGAISTTGGVTQTGSTTLSGAVRINGRITFTNSLISISADAGTTNTIVDTTATIPASVLKAGTAAPAINGSAITNLGGANIASGNVAVQRLTNALPFMCIAAGTCTNGQVVAYPAVASVVSAVILQPTEAFGGTWYPSSVNTTNFTAVAAAAAGTNMYYAVYGKF